MTAAAEQHKRHMAYAQGQAQQASEAAQAAKGDATAAAASVTAMFQSLAEMNSAKLEASAAAQGAREALVQCNDCSVACKNTQAACSQQHVCAYNRLISEGIKAEVAAAMRHLHCQLTHARSLSQAAGEEGNRSVDTVTHAAKADISNCIDAVLGSTQGCNPQVDSQNAV